MDDLTRLAERGRLLRPPEHDGAAGRLGHRRDHLRHPGRPHRPGQDADDHDPLLLASPRACAGCPSGRGTILSTASSRAWARAASSPSPARWWPRACPTTPARRPWAWCRPFPPWATSGPASISLGSSRCWSHGVIATHWRWMFSVGIVPSLLAVIVARKLREPEAWKRAVAEGQDQEGRPAASCSRDRRWRRNAIVGMLLAASGVVGLWGIGVFSNDLTQWFIGASMTTPSSEARRGGPGHPFRGPGDRLARATRRRGGQSGPRLLGTGERVLPGSDENQQDADAQVLYAAALKLRRGKEGRVCPERLGLARSARQGRQDADRRRPGRARRDGSSAPCRRRRRQSRTTSAASPRVQRRAKHRGPAVGGHRR